MRTARTPALPFLRLRELYAFCAVVGIMSDFLNPGHAEWSLRKSMDALSHWAARGPRPRFIQALEFAARRAPAEYSTFVALLHRPGESFIANFLPSYRMAATEVENQLVARTRAKS